MNVKYIFEKSEIFWTFEKGESIMGLAQVDRIRALNSMIPAGYVLLWLVINRSSFHNEE